MSTSCSPRKSSSIARSRRSTWRSAIASSPRDGLLILSTHGVWRYHPDPIDLWRWTSEGTAADARQAGFSVVHFRGMLGPAATGLQLWQDAVLPKWPAGLPATVFLRIMQNRIRAADLACPQEARDADASAYILVAQRGPHHGPGR